MKKLLCWELASCFYIDDDFGFCRPAITMYNGRTTDHCGRTGAHRRCL